MQMNIVHLLKVLIFQCTSLLLVRYIQITQAC